eukprot:jgi/Picsp_1/313/NSC_00312-R1_hypothetical protein COCSUDRAFT_41290 [Coccomyxa subellipsoidea C-169]
MAANIARSLPKTAFVSLNRPSLLEIHDSLLSVSKQKQSNSEVAQNVFRHDTVGTEEVRPVLPSAPPRQPKKFEMHIGGKLSIPGMTRYSRPSVSANGAEDEKSLASAPFAGLPFIELAEYLGEQVMPAIEAAKAEQQKAKLQEKAIMNNIEISVPYIPHILPVTRWAASDPHFRSTLVVDEDKAKKPRLSWYHPDDTMVPRDWFTGGLLADLKYYSPFGIFSESK